MRACVCEREFACVCVCVSTCEFESVGVSTSMTAREFVGVGVGAYSAFLSALGLAPYGPRAEGFRIEALSRMIFSAAVRPRLYIEGCYNTG